MRFSQDFIRIVQEASNIVDIISQYTQLKPAAGGFMGRCPFPDHPEKTPSFSVSDAKQVYNCFGCGKQGNIFQFLRDYNGMSFREAIEYLADRSRIPIPEDPSEDREKQDQATKRKKELMAANKIAAQFYNEQYLNLPEDHPARQYVNKRGLTPETVATFQIGYAPEEWEALAQYLRSQGVSMSVADEARLVKPRKEGNGHFDLFRDRLMFPIHNVMGDAIAFGGRIILQGEPKYLNSPETPVFTKGKILYGLAQTARFIRSEDQVLIVEGYMDLVSLYQAGIPQVVATMGTALTADHGRILARMTKNVIALFDGDQAGQNAAEKSLPLLLASDLHPKGLVLPDGMDPDDFIRAKGPEALQDMLSRAPDLFSMILGQWTREYRGESSEKVQLCDRLTPVFDSMRDNRLKGLYFREVQSKLAVDERWLLEALGLRGGGSANTGHAKIPPPLRPQIRENSAMPRVEPGERPDDTKEAVIEGVISIARAPSVEIQLFGLMLKNRAHWEEALRENVGNYLTHAGMRALLEKAIELSRQGPETFDKLTGLLTSIVDQSELLIRAGDPLGLRSADDDEIELQEIERELFHDYLKKVKDLALVAKAKSIQQQLRLSPTPELMEELMKIQRDRLALKKESQDSSSGSTSH